MKNESKTYRKMEFILYYKDENEISNLINIVNSTKMTKEYMYIIHDKDIYTESDFISKSNSQKENEYINYLLYEKKVKVGDKKDNHVHLAIRFNNSYELSKIESVYKKNILGLQIQFIKKNFNDALAYLIHANTIDKYKYDINDVKGTMKKEEYKKIVENITKKNNFKKYLSNEIATGKLTSDNYSKYFHDHNEFLQYKKYISDSLQFMNDKNQQDLAPSQVQKKHGNRDMKVIYIYGPGGYGKSNLAEDIAIKHSRTGDFDDIYTATTNNIENDYKNQSVILYDDIDSKSCDLKQLLNVLDNHKARKAKARFKDVTHYARLCILTSNEPLSVFYKSLKLVNSQDPNQFFRRIISIYEVKEKTIDYYKYDLELSENLKKFIIEDARFPDRKKFNMNYFPYIHKKTFENESYKKRLEEYSNDEEIFKRVCPSDKYKEVPIDNEANDNQTKEDPFADLGESVELESEDINLALNEVKKSEDESDAFDDIPDFE